MIRYNEAELGLGLLLPGFLLVLWRFDEFSKTVLFEGFHCNKLQIVYFRLCT